MSQPPISLDVLASAMTYWRAGLCVVPIKRDGSKAPALDAWKKYQECLPTEAEIRRWFGKANPPGMAAVCGAVSGNLELIDFDRRAEEIYPAWCDLVGAEQPGLLKRLTQVRTPKPGYHIWSRCLDVEIPGNAKLAIDPAAPSKERVLIETRGKGGYALVPGCPPECHLTGRTYDHIGGPALENVGDVSIEERDAMLRCARSFDLAVADDWQAPKGLGASSGLRPGDDYDVRGPAWADILEPHGWRRMRESDGAIYWRRPGKDGPGWSATTGRCRGKKGEDLLRVFSGNAAPFEEGKAYGKFRAFAFLNAGGNCSEAARELSGKGFGERRPSYSSVSAPPSANGAASSTTDEPPANGQPKVSEAWTVRLDEQTIITGDREDVVGIAPWSTRSKHARTYDLTTIGHLLAMQIAEPRWLIKGLLSEGLNILAGAPKAGKSMLALNLAITVAGGGLALDRHPVESADVLYLSLEDKQRRVKARTLAMLQKLAKDDPALAAQIGEHLTIITEWPRQHEGGLSMIRHWRDHCHKPGMVIIDVWNRFSPPSTSRQSGGNAYQVDSEHMGEVKQCMDHYELGSLVLHHTRKPGTDEPEDFVMELSGTLGLAGAADGVLVLLRKRNSDQAELHVTGRDVAEAEYVLRFEADTLTWVSTGTKDEHVNGEVQRAVVNYLRGLGGNLAFCPDIAEMIEQEIGSVRQACLRLHAKGIIGKQGRAYRYPGDGGEETSPEADSPF